MEAKKTQMASKILLLCILLLGWRTRCGNAAASKFNGFRFQKSSSPSSILEGTESAYKVVAKSAVPNNISLQLAAVDSLLATVTSMIDFYPSNWNNSYNFYLLGVEDDVILPSPYGGRFRVSSLSPNKTLNANGTLTVLIMDDDRAGVVIKRKESYPYPTKLPEGRWAVYEVTLPSQPQHPVNIFFHSLNNSLSLLPTSMVFAPDEWNVPQDLVVFALQENNTSPSSYDVAFNMSLQSSDSNFDRFSVPNFNLTVESDDLDYAVLSGSMSWRTEPSVSLTAAKITLTLTLSLDYYPNAAINDQLALPGSLDFGDQTGTQRGVYKMTVLTINREDGYLVAVTTIVHTYSYDNDYGVPWLTVFEYCCRGTQLSNNAGTTLTITITVDFSLMSTLLLPAIPLVHFTAGNSTQQFSYPALTSNGHPLVFSTGSPLEYRSSQAGTPQGVQVGHTTGLVTWDTTYVSPGDYSVQLVVTDALNGLKATSELLFRVSPHTSGNNPPLFHVPWSPLMPPSPLQVTPSSLWTYNISAFDSETILSTTVTSLLPLPTGASIEFQGYVAQNAVSQLLWNKTSGDSQIFCLIARDVMGLYSLPLCIPVVITQWVAMQPVLDTNGPLLPGPSFTQTFTKGLDQLAPLVSGDATIASTRSIELMCASLCQYPDGDSELVTVDPSFQQPILRYLPLSAPGYPTSVCFAGLASPSVYQQALRNLRYTNTKGSPTLGQRVAILEVYNGLAASSVQSSYLVLNVSIHNAPPTISVSGSTGSFYSTFFPHWGPVPAISPSDARVVDTDSVTITMATVSIRNALDTVSESLAATYTSPEQVSLPIVEQALDLNIPMGQLWNGGSVQTISSTITIATQNGYVGDISIVVDIRHSWIGDLTLQLEHLGYIDLLVLSPGGHTCSQDDLRGTVFSSNTSSNVFLSRGYQSPGICKFMTQGLFTPDGDLSRFRGLRIAGNWTLSIIDQVISVDTGRLVGWALVIQPKEDHLLWAWPPVVPPLAVYPGKQFTEHHQRAVESDGRITDLAVHVHLSVPFGAVDLYAPTLTLVHPDGTAVLLFNGSVPLCAAGNYTYVIFKDHAPKGCDFVCASNASEFGSGSGSSSGSGSGSGLGVCDSGAQGLLKPGLVDLMPPATPLSALKGKLAGGTWVLQMSPSSAGPSHLLGWSMRIAREPNVYATYDNSSQQLIITGADSPLNYQKVLQSVVYDNAATNMNFSVPRLVVTAVFDGQAYSNSSVASSSSFLTIHHIDLVLDPVASSWEGSLTRNVSFVENQPPLPLFNSQVPALADPVFRQRNYTLYVTLKDCLDIGMEGLTLNASATPNIKVTNYSDVLLREYRLVATSSGLTSVADYQALLSTLKYFNYAVVFNGAGRRVDIVITDTTNGSLFTSGVGVVNIGFIYVDHPPVLILNNHIAQTDTTSNVLGYTEGDPPLFLANATGLVLIDVDNTTLVSITVTILDPADGANEVLSANTTGTNISSYYNYSSNTLLLSGVASLNQYRAVLSTVTYDNLNANPGNPGTIPRSIAFVPFDGIRSGNASIAYVLFTAVNNAPFGDLNGVSTGTNTTALYVERDPPVPLCPTAAVFDVDNVTLASIEVRILNNRDGPQEVLASGLGTTHFNPHSSVLTITGLPTVQAFQSALRNLTYVNYADEPNTTPRVIEVVMSDGLDLSSPLYVTINITLVNDSPYFNSSAPPFEPFMVEDESLSANSGWAVNDMSYLIEDSDEGALRGVAIVGYDTSLGLLQYSLDGTNWITVSASVSLTHSLLLSDEPGHMIRFIPVTYYNGPVNISIVAWDRTDQLPSGNYTDAHHTSLESPYSAQTLRITLFVIPINNAPVLQGIPLWLTPIKEDNMTSSGDPVTSLLLHVTDPDLPSVFGVAIIGADQTNGTWQYSTDSGRKWYPFGAVKPSWALVLQGVAGTLVRFVPKMYFTGDVSFQYKAWDLTTFYEDYGSGFDSGSGPGFSTNGSNASNTSFSSYPSGTLVNTLLSDPINGPFSVNTTNASIHVIHVNHSPLVYSNMALNPILEDTPPDMNHGTTVANIIKFYTLYYDFDANSDSGLAVVGVDNRYGTWQYSCSGTLNWTSFIGDVYYGYQIPALPTFQKATLLLSTCSIRFLPSLYFNTQVDPNGYPRPPSDTPYISVLGWDNTGLSAGRSGTYGNDASYYGTSSSAEYSASTVRATITVISVDNVPILLLNNSMMPNYRTTYYEDVVPVAIVGSGVTLIDNDNATLKDLTITIHGSFDQSPFEDIEFENTTASYGPGISSSPVYPSLQDVTEYVKNLTSPTSWELYCAGLTSMHEIILVSTVGSDLTSQILSWCPFSVRIFGVNNSFVSKEQFRYVLSMSLYNNSIDPFIPGDRTLTFVVSDGLGLSLPVNTTITVVSADDAPVLDLNNNEPDFNNHVTYVEGEVELPLTNETGLVLTDVDNSTLLYARVTILDHPDGDHEILDASTAGTSISVVYVLSNHTLYFYGNASVQDYVTVLKTVSYTNTFANPGNPSTLQRRVLFIASDGLRDSAPVYSYVSFTAVNNAPWMDANGNTYGADHAVAFTEERGPVSIFDPAGFVTDIDNITLFSILVRIMNPYDSSLEYLEADPLLVYYQPYVSNGQVVMASSVINVTGNINYNPASTTLNISGLPTLEQYNMVLRTVRYNNLKHKIDLRNRLVQFVANDGLLNSTAVYTNVTMVPVNHPPYFTNYSVITSLILENQTNWGGVTVYDIITGNDNHPYPGLIGDDDDVHYISDKGIAVVAVDNSQGVWQYKLGTGGSFVPFHPNITLNMALLLRGTQFRNLYNYIRYVPNLFFNGNASLTFLAWDTYYPLSDGTTKDATTPDLQSPFSVSTRTLWVVIVPVNNAPTVNTSVVVTMTPVNENTVSPSGDDVSLFLAALQGDADLSVINLQSFGIAVVNADFTNGVWQYSTNGGRNWTTMTTPTPTSATVLTSTPPQQQRVRFVPQRYFFGTSSITYVIWDRNTSFPSGSVVSTLPPNGVDPYTYTFSVQTATATINVLHVNNAPFISGNAQLYFIWEDPTTAMNPGYQVLFLIVGNVGGLYYYDVDPGSLMGIAVVGVDRRYGNWQYSCGLPRVWYSFVGGYLQGVAAPADPSDQYATLLDSSSCLVRFIPQANFNSMYDLNGNPRPASDTPSIKFRGWDQTYGAVGQVGVNTSYDPLYDSGAFSKNVSYGYLTVNSVNDLPVLWLNGQSSTYSTVYTEPIPLSRVVRPVSLVNTSNFSLSDVDNASLTYITVSFTLKDGSAETITGSAAGTVLNITTIVSSTTYKLTISPLVGVSAPIASFTAVLRSLQYQNTKKKPTNTNRIITFTVSDGIGTSNAFTTMVIIQVDDPPELDLNATMPDIYNVYYYVEGQGPAYIVDPSVTLEVYNPPLLVVSATVTIQYAPDGSKEVLAANTSGTNITATYTGTTLLLLGPATPSDFRRVISTVTYTDLCCTNDNQNSYKPPSTQNRTIEFVVYDGTNYSVPAQVYLFFSPIDTPPFLDLSGNVTGISSVATFYDQSGPISVVAPDAILYDIDNVTLSYIKVTILNPLDGALETLWVEPVSVPYHVSRNVMGVITYTPTQTYNSTTSTLLITDLDAVPQFELILRTLKYNNLASIPKNTTRVLSVAASDGLLETVVNASIIIVVLNDAPYFNTSAILYQPVVAENTPVTINVGWSVEDLTSWHLLQDDNADSLGIAVVGLDTRHGRWEYTTDFVALSNTTSANTSVVDTVNSTINDTVNDLMNDTFGSGSGMSEPVPDNTTTSQNITAAVKVCSKYSPPATPPDPPSTFSANWHPLSVNTSITMATLLKVNGSFTRLRFLPNKYFTGVASFQVVAWDGTDNRPSGSVANVTYASQMGAFSATVFPLSVVVYHVNNAPFLSNTTAFTFTPLLENHVSATGDDVSSLVSSISDVDGPGPFGIAVIQVDSSNGTWQYSTNGGSSWTNMSNICPQNATLLRSYPPGLNRVRFVPNIYFFGNVSLWFLGWDLTSGEASGTQGVDITTADTLHGAFSIIQTSATITVIHVNNAPFLYPGAKLSSIPEDMPIDENNGTAVVDIVAGVYLDVDPGYEVGVAVVGVDLRFGVWQWWCPQSMTWQTFVGDIYYGVVVPKNPQLQKATLLAGDCRVRFLPNLNFNSQKDNKGFYRPLSDQPFINILGWDNTGASKGKSGWYGVDASYYNLSTIDEFSGAVRNATIEIISVDDPTVVRISSVGSGTHLNVEYTQLTPYVRVVEPWSVSLKDVDNAYLESLTVSVINPYDIGTESIWLLNSSAVTFVNDSLAIVSINNTQETVLLERYTYANETNEPYSYLHMYSDSSNISIEAFQALLMQIVYSDVAMEPDNTTRHITFEVNDGILVTTAQTDVRVILFNAYNPVLNNSMTSFHFTEGGTSPVPLVSPDMTLTDIDNNLYFFMGNFTISLSPVPASPYENVSVDTSSYPSLTHSYDPRTGTLLVSGAAPVSTYQTILRSAMYHNTADKPEPGLRTASIQVTDLGGRTSNVVTVVVNVSVVNNHRPAVVVPNTTFVYIQHQPPVNISRGILLIDADSRYFEVVSLTLTIEDAYDEDNETLDAIPVGNIRKVYANYSLVLTGPASLFDFQRTIASLSYINNAVLPHPDTRHISVVMYDGRFYSSPVDILVSIQLVNYPPVVNLQGPLHMSDTIVNYFEGSGPQLLTPDAVIADLDNDTLIGLVARLKYPYDHPLEELFVEEHVNITVAYDNTTGVLTLTGEAPVAVYEQLLRSLSYDDGHLGNPNTHMRLVEVEVFDGIDTSVTRTVSITFNSVNDAPFLDLSGPTREGNDFGTGFVENGLPVNITSPDMILFDIDNATLNHVLVSILNPADIDEVLIPPYINSNVQYDNTSILITGLATTMDFQNFVAGIMFLDSAYVMRSYDTRVISFVANDGLLNSTTRYTKVQITHVNHPPVLTISGIRPALSPLATPTSSLHYYSSTSDPSPSSSPSSSYLSTPLLSPTPFYELGSGQDSNATNETTLDSTSSPTFSPTSSSTFSSSVMPTPVSTPSVAPPITESVYNDTFVPGPNYFITFTENDRPIPVVDRSSVTVSDPDANDTSLYLLEVVLEGAVDGSYEGIFVDASTLRNTADLSVYTKMWQSYSNVLSLTGDCKDVTFSTNATVTLDFEITLSPSEWVQVIRSLRYCNHDKNMTTGNRTVTFRIKDHLQSGNWSNAVYTTIVASSINDPPMYNPPADYTAEYTVDEDHNITFNLLQYFSDYDNVLSGAAIRLFEPPSHGWVSIDNATGNITYYTALHDYGLRYFIYQACDPLNACSDPVNVTVTVLYFNYPPYPVRPLEVDTLEDTPITINVTYYFADVQVPTGPWVEDVAVSAGDWHFLDQGRHYLVYYKPPLYQFNNFSVNMSLCNYLACVPYVIVVMVTRVNYPPVILVDALYTIQEGENLTATITVTDVESRLLDDIQLEYAEVTHGRASVSRLSSGVVKNVLEQTWQLVYVPDIYYNGMAAVKLVAMDSENSTTTAVVNITVSYVNFPPSFGIVNLTAHGDTPLVLILPQDLNITDADDPVYPDLFSIIQWPSVGNATYLGGVLRYVAPLNYYSHPSDQPVTMVMKGCDNNSIDVPKCQVATIYIWVEFLNHPPIFSTVVMYVLEDQANFTSLNISATLSDVDSGDSTPLNGTHITTPPPAHGSAFYDNRTGNISYKPDPGFYGIDHIFVQACDTHSGCSLGNVTVVVQNVNRPPVVLNFSQYSYEDDFDLIALYEHVSDSETPHDNILGALLFGIVNSTTGVYSNLGTTSMGGALRVYNTHGIATYAPPPGFVGVDTFTYSVCDPCDPAWATELGRPLLVNCTLQQQRIGTTTARIACSVGIVTVYVVAVKHVPTLQTLSAVISTGETHTFKPFDDSAVPNVSNGSVYWYRNASAPIFDLDDLQSYTAIQNNLNLTLFRLRNTSSIDEGSLTLVSAPTHGVAQVMFQAPYGRGVITYTPFYGFSGYEQFNYQVCSKNFGDGVPAKCSVAVVMVFVSKLAPNIVAISAASSGAADTMISKNDQILVTFDEATNMPPQNSTAYILKTSEVDKIFSFATPFINTALVTDAYSGVWINPTQFQITITDEGYPQPFSSTLNQEIALGVWTVSINQSRGPCNKLTNQQSDPYCLLTADGTSLQANSTSPGLTGSFGNTMPRVSFIAVRNDLVDTGVRLNNPGVLLFQGTRLVVLLQQALSYFQLMQLCSVQASEILDLTTLDKIIQLEIDGCSNYLANGKDANEIYAYQIGVMGGHATTAGTLGKRSTDDRSVSQSKRSSSTLTSAYEEPVTSEMVFRITTLTNPTVADGTVLSGAIKEGFNWEQLSGVIYQSARVSPEQPTDSSFQVMVEGDEDKTPQIHGVAAGNPLNDQTYGKGDTVTIYFDKLTNKPPVATKADLDKILTITPSLGNDYNGKWLDGSTLQITVVDPTRPTSVPVPKSSSCVLTFTQNYDTLQRPISAYLGSVSSSCIGSHLCDTLGITVGICSQDQLSCRVSQTVTGFSGSFDTTAGAETASSTTALPDVAAILIAIFCVVAIAIVLVVVFFCYRHYKLKSQRKEALRVVQRWKKDNYAPGKAVKKDGEPKAWTKPPDTGALRTIIDPFVEEPKTVRAGDSAGIRPATAAPEVENLPPLPQQRLFLPRSQPRIPTVLPDLQSIPEQMPRARVNPQPPPVALGPSSVPNPTATRKASTVSDSRTTLKPLNDPKIAILANKALQGGQVDPSVPLPRAQAAGRKPAKLEPLTLEPKLPPLQIPEDTSWNPEKGKGPSGGKKVPKKTTPTASSEDDSNSRGSSENSESKTPTPPPAGKPTTKIGGEPLPPIGSIPLPPIGGVPLPPIGTTTSAPIVQQEPTASAPPTKEPSPPTDDEPSPPSTKQPVPPRPPAQRPTMPLRPPTVDPFADPSKPVPSGRMPLTSPPTSPLRVTFSPPGSPPMSPTSPPTSPLQSAFPPVGAMRPPVRPGLPIRTGFPTPAIGPGMPVPSIRPTLPITIRPGVPFVRPLASATPLPAVRPPGLPQPAVRPNLPTSEGTEKPTDQSVPQ